MQSTGAKSKRGRKGDEWTTPISVQVLDRSLAPLSIVAETNGATLTALSDRTDMAAWTPSRAGTALRRGFATSAKKGHVGVLWLRVAPILSRRHD
ncbi:hypothetical protein B5K06_29870 [Rhizobium grahamii]|uniref:Uncharacterized protein n=1 Tax=Rhizobium grahamii TaxID=1120045 RepID=A0A370KFP3_9HYPH|nr:hypothetical protein B5K06_29870 [Rhizobium grahamii]